MTCAALQGSSGRLGRVPRPCRSTSALWRSLGRRSRVQAMSAPGTTSRPVIVLDVMDTIVKDPFFQTMPKFFNMSFKELLAAKHPTAWVEFETATMPEEQLLTSFFRDGRSFDHQALIATMVDAYDYIEGMPQLLQRLQSAGFEMHACSNYPVWYKLIESKLQLSQYLKWTFVSCDGVMKGMRKPAPSAYACVIEHLQLPASQLVFVDDRQGNVDAAQVAGMDAIRFESAQQLESQLLQRGCVF